MKFLLETAAKQQSPVQWVLPAVLLVLVIGIFILNYFKSKKANENMQQVINQLKVGDNVKTYSGFYGKIVEITETTDGKVAVLQTGTEGNYGYISIDMNAIYAIDEKKPVLLDAEGNVVDETKPAEVKDENAEPVKEEKTELVNEDKVETVNEDKVETQEEVEPVKEEKPKTKKSTKKSTKKAAKSEN